MTLSEKKPQCDEATLCPFLQSHYDVLIIGGGAAGLSTALELPNNLSVCIITKGEPSQSCTYYAQGGIAAAIADDDTPASHAQDTLTAGAGLCNEAVANIVTSSAPATIDWLCRMGVEFTRDDSGKLHLTREGGHSRQRIVHSYDTTGKALQSALYEKALARENTFISHDFIAVDLIIKDKHSRNSRCRGAYVLNKSTHKVHALSAAVTILATGGAGKTYLYTTNPDSSSGDGIAMAWRAGCRVANMHLMQFHPTGLYHPESKSFLISESLRGEGAKLLLPDGSEFMHRYDIQGALAPRDTVARAIDNEMKRHGLDCVFLDISHRGEDFIRKSFPKTYRNCLKFGFDLTKAPIPVVPMVHYTCGGVIADIAGRTDIAGLRAIGETAHTGLHGANRLASNSLLECVVCGCLCARAVGEDFADSPRLDVSDIASWDESRVIEPDQEVIVSHGWDDVRHIMWNYVGIVRSYDRLMMAKQRVRLLFEESLLHYRRYKISSDSIEFRNLTLVAALIIHSALARKESRGLHYMVEYPDPDPALDAVDTVLDPADELYAGIPNGDD